MITSAPARAAPPATVPLDRRDWAILAALLVLVALGAVATGLTGAVEDTWRDIYFAYLISSGEGWPLAGPVIGNIAHLGPAWYYLLAPAFAVGGAGALLGTVGLLASLKFPLAYLLGRLAVDRAFGLLLALALLGPGWSMFELLWPTHTGAVSTALLALALATHCHRRRPTTLTALTLGVLAGLAVHAHPTTLLLAAALGFAALMAPAGATRRFRDAALMAGAAAMLFVPLLFVQWQDGGQDLRGLQRYAAEELQPAVVDRLWPLLRGLAWGGAEMMHSVLLQRPWSAVLLGVHGVSLLAAGVGLRWIENRRWLAWLLLALLAQSLFLLVLRPISPFWMSYAHVPLLAALLALGWRGLWLRFAVARWLLLAIAAGHGLGHATLLLAVAYAPEETVLPTYPTGSPGTMSITALPTGSVTVPVTRLPTLGMRALGARLCQPSAIYGHLAAWADESFGVGIRAACGSVAQVALGGTPSAGSAAWVGLGKAAQRASGLPTGTGMPAMTVHPVAAVWRSADPLDIVAGGRFPRRTIDASLSEFSIAGRAAGNAVVVVASRAVGYYPFEMLTAEVNGVGIQPLFRDRYLALYHCRDCVPDRQASWHLHISGAAALVDVLTVLPAATAD